MPFLLESVRFLQHRASDVVADVVELVGLQNLPGSRAFSSHGGRRRDRGDRVVLCAIH